MCVVFLTGDIMVVEVVTDYEAMSERAAERIAGRINAKPDSVIGFATGSTPIGLYKSLINRHRNGELDFSQLTSFNLDEYVGLDSDHEQSYYRFMFEQLFSHVNIDKNRIHIPDGMVNDIEAYCSWYESEIEKRGGLDVQILGIGANGHLGFNEPGSSLGSRTRRVTLTDVTVNDNARFFDHPGDVPRHAVTMGIGTILEAKSLLLLASGAGKAEAIRNSLEGPITAMVPGTALQWHPDVHIIIDEAAASALTYSHHHGIAEPKH